MMVCCLVGLAATHDARAMSRPAGDMVAEPTRPSTRMLTSASKVSLSTADLMALPLDGSICEEGILLMGQGPLPGAPFPCKKK